MFGLLGSYTNLSPPQPHSILPLPTITITTTSSMRSNKSGLDIGPEIVWLLWQIKADLRRLDSGRNMVSSYRAVLPRFGGPEVLQIWDDAVGETCFVVF
ncbi:hypothetical protein LIER_05797 [Lithospermum erythrorhizon]|uniref:Uncharacterized protein n=1 Tax=Lithospermum erythrorhizon TaxID=34254 RepID=A0AAV3P1T9_LITER